MNHKNKLQTLKWLIKFIYGFAKFQPDQHNLPPKISQPDCPEPSCFGVKEILNHYKQHRIALSSLFYYHRNQSGHFTIQYAIRDLTDNPFVIKPCIHIKSMWAPSGNHFKLTQYHPIKTIPCSTTLNDLIILHDDSSDTFQGVDTFKTPNHQIMPLDNTKTWPLTHTKESWNRLINTISLPTQHDQSKASKNHLFTDHLYTAGILLGLVALTLGYSFLFHKKPAKKIKRKVNNAPRSMAIDK